MKRRERGDKGKVIATCSDREVKAEKEGASDTDPTTTSGKTSFQTSFEL